MWAENVQLIQNQQAWRTVEAGWESKGMESMAQGREGGKSMAQGRGGR